MPEFERAKWKITGFQSRVMIAGSMFNISTLLLAMWHVCDVARGWWRSTSDTHNNALSARVYSHLSPMHVACINITDIIGIFHLCRACVTLCMHLSEWIFFRFPESTHISQQFTVCEWGNVQQQSGDRVEWLWSVDSVVISSAAWVLTMCV